MPTRPNVLLILTDQQSVYALGANGNRDLRTPTMDALAARGCTFIDSYCTYPVCSPSRASIFTSRMPHETGVSENGKGIKAGIPSLGPHFAAAGYDTVYSGKWHLPKPFANPTGFRQLYGGATLAKDMDAPCADACIEYLRRAPKQPFFMVASFMNPHDICEWIRQHRGSRTHPDLTEYPQPRLNMAISPDEPEYVQNHRTSGYNTMAQAVTIAADWNTADFRQYLHDYYRMIEAVDDHIGRVITALKFAGLYDDTVILLTTDHGEGMGAHRWVQKAAFWEETTRVPMIVSGPGVKPSRTVIEGPLVSGLDVLPTLCDYAGIEVPAGIRGRSLRPAIEGRPWNRDYVVSELSAYGSDDREGRMLRTTRFKYVVFNGGARPEQLFDLGTDPGETQNLVNDPKAQGKLNDHRAILRAWLNETNDPFEIPKV